MSIEPAILAIQNAILDIAVTKLGRKLTDKETVFVTSRHGLIALEMIMDTVKTESMECIEEYLNSENESNKRK